MNEDSMVMIEETQDEVANMLGITEEESTTLVEDNNKPGDKPETVYEETATAATGIPSSQVELNKEMRKLWEDNIVWARMTIVDLIDDVLDREKAISRLLKNSFDIEAVFAPYFGSEAADRLRNLLTEVSSLVTEMTFSLKTGEIEKADSAETRSHDCASEIAGLLGSVNPNWSRDDLFITINEHLALTKSQIMARIVGDYDADITAYDAIHDNILLFADTLSDGVIAQFPERFKIAN